MTTTKLTLRYEPSTVPGEQGVYVGRMPPLKDGSRPWFRARGPRSPQAEERARERLLAAWERAIEAGHGAEYFGIRTRKPKSSAEPVRPLPVPRDDARAMAAWLSLWLKTRKARGHTSTRENASHYEQHVRPVLGDKHVRDWTVDDMRKLSRSLDEEVRRASSEDPKIRATGIKWKTATNVWGTATKMVADAARSKIDELRVRTDNPAADVEGPDRGERTGKQYLYPSEFSAFVACSDVPLIWRRAVALAVYLYPRAGELRALDWEDVDLEHGSVHIHRAEDRETGTAKGTKTKHPRRFNIDPALLPLLAAMHEETGGEGLVCSLPSERDMARGLRRWLKKAGVERAELHDATPTRKAITFHDLRATGITWMAIRGDEPLRIQQRAGHESFATTAGYIREAEAIRDGFGHVFPSLPKTLLTSSDSSATPPSGGVSVQELVQRSPRRANYAVFWRGGRDSNPRPPA